MHNIGEHFLIPQALETKPGFTEARKKLRELSNDLFEELAADVYDEVDRREMDEGEMNIYMYIYIIESIDSISRDGPDTPIYIIHYKKQNNSKQVKL